MKLKIYYSVTNGGDGSAYPYFTTNERYAEIHQELVNMGEGWGEDCTGSLEIESDSPIVLCNNYGNITRESLLEQLEDKRDSDYFKKHLEQIEEYISELNEE